MIPIFPSYKNLTDQEITLRIPSPVMLFFSSSMIVSVSPFFIFQFHSFTRVFIKP